MEMELGGKGHDEETGGEGHKLEHGMFVLLVELGGDHLNAGHEEEGAEGETIQNLVDERAWDEFSVKFVVHSLQAHTQKGSQRSQDGVEDDEEEVVAHGEASLGHTRSQSKGLDPLVHEEGDEEGDELALLPLCDNTQALKEAVDGEGDDKDDGLELGGFGVDSVHVATSHQVILVTISVFSLSSTNGDHSGVVMLMFLFSVMMMVVVSVGAARSMLVLMGVFMFLILRSGFLGLFRVGILAVGVRQEETIDGEEDEEGETGGEGTPSETMGMASVVTMVVVIVGMTVFILLFILGIMAVTVSMAVLLGLLGFFRFSLLALVIILVLIAVEGVIFMTIDVISMAVALFIITAMSMTAAVIFVDVLLTDLIQLRRAKTMSVIMSMLHHLRDHVHQHSTKNNSTSQRVHVRQNHAGTTDLLPNHKRKVAEHQGQREQGNHAQNFLFTERDSSESIQERLVNIRHDRVRR